MPKGQRILVVEDDLQMAEIIHWNLFAAGFQVTIATDGMSALRKFDEEHPDIVTIDLNVPEVSGFRLVKLFKRYAPNVPVIVVTASAWEEAEDIAHDRADDFLNKPFDPHHLIQKVIFHLNRTRPHHAASGMATPSPALPPRTPMAVG